MNIHYSYGNHKLITIQIRDFISDHFRGTPRILVQLLENSCIEYFWKLPRKKETSTNVGTIEGTTRFIDLQFEPRDQQLLQQGLWNKLKWFEFMWMLFLSTGSMAYWLESTRTKLFIHDA